MSAPTATPVGTGHPALAVHGIDFSYGPLQVLFDVELEVARGGRVALLGTNGAGKSTLLRVVSGLGSPTRGTVSLDGEDVTRLSAHRRVERGLVQVNGGRSTFPSLSVYDNLRIGAYPSGMSSEAVADRIASVLDVFPELADRMDQPAGSLSGGEQQMVAIGRAVVAQPRVLLIDELSLGLAPVAVEAILRMVDRLADVGTTMLVVEQSLDVARAMCDEAYFMEKGEVRFSGPIEDLMSRGDLVRSVFFGSGAES